MAFLSVLLSAFCLITRKSLLRAIFGAVEADVMRNSQVYFFFTLLSFPFIGLYDAGASIMRAQNNSRNPMVISVISNFMKIGSFSLRSCMITTIAQNIRDTRVEIAAPSTPMPKPKIRIALPLSE